MKFAKRVVSGLLGTVVLTTFILYAINSYHVNQPASRVTAPADSESGSHIKQSSKAAENGTDAKLSIDFSERHMVYQSQEAANTLTDPEDADDGQTDTGMSAASDGNGTVSRTDKNNGQAGPGDSEPDTDASGTDKTGSQSAPDSDEKDNQSDPGTDNGKDESGAGKNSSKTDTDSKAGSANADNKTATGNTRKDESAKKDSKTSTGSTSKDESAKKNSKTAADSSKAKSAETGSKSGSGKKGKDESDTGRQNGQAYTFQTVSEDYFSDALFIGDSRTVGMQQSGLLPNATYYAKTGIGIGEILSQRIVNEGGYLISVKDALSRHSFAKVYIMIGINDMSMGDTEWFTERYTEILDTVRATQPDAVIYIQGNIPMSYGTQDLHGSLNNQNLKLRDEASQTLADSKTVFYLDVNTLYADANGHLASMYTTDGLHIKSNYYPLWVDYLKHRAIVR